MQRVDKILLATLIPIIVGVVVTTVVLAVLYRACPADQTWDLGNRVCRAQCPGERNPGGQRYDAATQQCVCPTSVAPHWDAAAQQCVGECDPGETWNGKTQSCDPGTVATCTPLPSVNDDSGVIENASHFPRPRSNCGEGTQAELDALCRASTCGARAGCGAQDTWDGYDVNNRRCFKRVNCGSEGCDAPYCTSVTVKAVVGPVQKVQQGDVCVNPPASLVAGLCADVGNTKWVNPNCLSMQPQQDAAVQVTVTSATVTEGIVGSVSHVLINGMVDVGGDSCLTYRYTLVARQPSMRGTDDLSDVLPLTACTVNTAGHDAYATFLIPVPAMKPGEYLLSITGYPAWDTTLPLYPASSPAVIALKPDTGDATIVLPSVKFDTALARTLCADVQLVNANLSRLNERYPGSVTPLPTDSHGLVLPPTSRDDTSPFEPVVVPCTGSYCMVSEAVAYKLVVVAWYPLAPPAAGVCTSGESLVRYTLTRSIHGASTAQTDGCRVSDGVQDCVLIGPTPGQNQPSAVEVATGHLMFLDLVPVNTTATYSLGAYLVDTPGSTLQYEFAQCRSPLFDIGLSVKPYSNAECATIAVPGKVPPYMTMNNAMCNYDDSEVAQDFYCYFNYPPTAPDPKARYLSKDGKCYKLVQGPINLQHTWTDTHCSDCWEATTNTEKVKCPNYVQMEHLGDSGKLDDVRWKERLGALVSNFDQYKQDAGAKVANTEIATPEKQLALFQSYTRCGPTLSPGGYGSSGVGACDAGDATCVEMAKNASCGKGQNYCESWVSAGQDAEDKSLQFSRTRWCYNWPEIGTDKSVCCSGRGMYLMEGDVQQPGKQVGLCRCPLQTWGDKCEYDPCEATFGVGQPQCGLLDDPTKTGTCYATGPNKSDYYCEPQYFVLLTNGYYEFQGPGHRHMPQSYRVIPLGNSFTTMHTSAMIAEYPGASPDQIRVEIGKGDKTDEVVAQLVLYEGTLGSTFVKENTVLSPPGNKVVAKRDADRLVEREHDGYIVVNNLGAQTTPNTAYTLAILLTFPQGTGTDDLVRVHYPARMVVRTTSQ
jgi:hypothetical protein